MQVDIPGPDLAMVIQCVIISLGGLFANGSLLFVITRSKQLRRKDYICFIFNRTLLDFIFCIQLGTLDVIGILASSPTSSFCVAAGALQAVFGSASIYTEPFLACNRYISIFYSNSYKKIFTLRNVYIMCVGTWVLGGISSLPHIFVGSLGRSPGSICSIRFAPETLAVTVGANYTLVLLALGSILFFNFKMYQFVKSHQDQPMTNSQRSKLQNDREMLKFIFVAAFLPLLLQAPSMVIFLVQMIIPVSGWLNFSALAIYSISFIINPVITLLMVRPIRNQFMTTYKKVTGQNTAVVSFQNHRTAIASQIGISRMIRVDEQQTDYPGIPDKF